MASVNRTNPYVGPRAYTSQDKEDGRLLYGRNREVEELTDLLLAERIVLLYAPSGAGKSSLINAELIPRMREEEGFDILPTIRLNKTPADYGNARARINRYVYSALLSISTELPKERRPEEEPGSNFDEYLHRILPLGCGNDSTDSSKSQLLVFDQFEEVLTCDSTDVRAKQEFFAQLGEVVRHRGRWALIAMREDYVAALDPYLAKIPTRLRSTFRLDFLSKEQAATAIQQPASDAGVTFHGIAVNKLVEDLSKVRVQRADGSFDLPRSGPYVEPVQLQVVCHQLWERLPPGTKEIGRLDLDLVGDVDQSLGNYYGEKISQAAALTPSVTERQVRHWVDGLMTETGIRLQILREENSTRGLDNDIVEFLVNAHLLRREERGNRIWYELAHDRLIEPIKRDNLKWREANLSEGWELSRAEVQEYSPVSRGERRGTALCLGGGGFRAAIFHLGALTRLNELGVLSQLDTISTAGGGSILVAHLIKHLDPWPGPCEVVEPERWERQVLQSFRAFSREDLQSESAPGVIRMIDFFSGQSWAMRNLARRLERRIIDLPLSRLPEKPKVIFGATDLVFATHWVFQRSRMGDYQAGFISPPPDDWTVARAVAASSGVPTYFATMKLDLAPAQLTGGKFEDTPRRERLIRGMRLASGEYYDHLALAPVWKNHAVVLVSDGGSKLEPTVAGDFMSRLLRPISVTYARVDTQQKAWLLSNFVSGILQGTYWSAARNASEYEADIKPVYSQAFVDRYISKIRTDLRNLDEGDAAILENHGYLMAEVGMRRRQASDFEFREAEIKVPHPEWMREDRVKLRDEDEN